MWTHRLTSKDTDARTGVCQACGPVPIVPKDGGWRCGPGRDAQRGPNRWYRRAIGEACERCGFTGEPCQLDVHHVDGDHGNNDPSNLRTLCANCHRLEHRRPTA